MTKILETNVDFHDGDHDGRLVIQRSQEVTQNFLDTLKEARNASTSRPMGDWHRVASIPTAVYETWLRQGYDAQKEPIQKTVAKLKLEGLDYFLTTDRKI